MQRTIRAEAFRPPCGLAAIGVPLANLLERGSPLIRDSLGGRTMAKLVADVRTVLIDGIHSMGAVHEGQIRKGLPLPRPDRVVIEIDSEVDGPCMLFRFSTDGRFCGDTWHENLETAVAQANYEYGLVRGDFVEEES